MTSSTRPSAKQKDFVEKGIVFVELSVEPALLATFHATVGCWRGTSLTPRWAVLKSGDDLYAVGSDAMSGAAWLRVIAAWTEYGNICDRWFWSQERALRYARKHHAIQRYRNASLVPPASIW